MHDGKCYVLGLTGLGEKKHLMVTAHVGLIDFNMPNHPKPLRLQGFLFLQSHQ